MICETVEELTPIIGTRPACRALGASVATIYRRRRPPEPRPSRRRPTPGRALSQAERERVLELLHCERFVDCAPEQVYASHANRNRRTISTPGLGRSKHERSKELTAARTTVCHGARTVAPSIIGRMKLPRIAGIAGMMNRNTITAPWMVKTLLYRL